MANQGIETDEWEHLVPTEQRGWEDLAAELSKKKAGLILGAATVISGVIAKVHAGLADSFADHSIQFQVRHMEDAGWRR